MDSQDNNNAFLEMLQAPQESTEPKLEETNELVEEDLASLLLLSNVN